MNRVPTWTAQLREGTQPSSLFQQFDHLTDTNVFVSYPQQMEDILGKMRPDHRAGRRNVAHLAWEQKGTNPWWKVVYDRYDEIWAISEFAATGFRRMFPGRVRVTPNVLNFDEFPEYPETMAARLEPPGRSAISANPRARTSVSIPRNSTKSAAIEPTS